MGLFDLIKKGIKKTREVLFMDVRDVFRIGRKIDESLLAELGDKLVQADVGPKLSAELVEEVRVRWRRKEIEDAEQIPAALKAILAGTLL